MEKKQVYERSKDILLLMVLFFLIFFTSKLFSQINPIDSPYEGFGIYNVLSDSDMTTSPTILTYRPDNLNGAPYPVFIFQLGANGFTGNAINNHTYDIYLKHLASWGYVVIVVNDAQAGFPNGTSFTTVHNWYKAKVLDNTHWMSDYADVSKVVIGGHSNGGVNATALLINRPNEIQGIVYFASYPSSPFPNHDVSNYAGVVLSLAGTEDATSTPTACKNGYNKFTSSSCKVWGLISGLDHGGFGDYLNANQPVGSIGRINATATIRHYLLSFMESQFKGDSDAFNHLHNVSNRPNTTNEFLSNCSLTSYDELNSNGDLNIYPNPFSENIVVKFKSNTFEEKEVTIIDLYGRVVKYISNIKNDYINIKVEDLSSGLYTFKIKQGNKVLTNMVIKK